MHTNPWALVYERRFSWMAILVPLLFMGCPVDDRVLVVEGFAEPQDAGRAGPEIGPEGGQPGNSLDAARDAAAARVDAPVEDSGPWFDGFASDAINDACSDLVTNCAPSLVRNYGFDDDADGWMTDVTGNVVLSWHPEDALANSESGSMRVDNATFLDVEGASAAGPTQCLSATESATYDYSVQAVIPETQDGEIEVGPRLWFFPEEECIGTPLRIHKAPPIITKGTWQRSYAEVRAPHDTRSMAIQLAVSKPLRVMASFGALFDDVIVRVR